jgi:hypothetical protein
MSIEVSKTGDIRSSRELQQMHKDRCGLSQLYLWYASKGSSLVLLYTVSIGGRVCLGE